MDTINKTAMDLHNRLLNQDTGTQHPEAIKAIILLVDIQVPIPIILMLTQQDPVDILLQGVLCLVAQQISILIKQDPEVNTLQDLAVSQLVTMLVLARSKELNHIQTKLSQAPVDHHNNIQVVPMLIWEAPDIQVPIHILELKDIM